MDRNEPKGKQQKTGSKILLQIMVLILMVFVASGILSLVFYLRSTRDLTERNKEMMIKARAQDMSTSFVYVADVIGDQILESLDITGANIAEFAYSIINKTPMPVQIEANKKMKEVVDKGVLETELLVFVIPPVPPAIPEPIVVMSSDEQLVYSDVPEEVYEVYESGNEYGIIKDGIPEWNIEGEQLVVFEDFLLDESSGVNGSGYATAIRNIEGDIEEIDEYLEKEKEEINVLMFIVIAGFSFALFIIIFVVLRYLIRSRITRPIEELSNAAEQVMEGDLDIEVPVRKGEEFVNLKTAFNAMLKSIRDIISRSTGEKP